MKKIIEQILISVFHFFSGGWTVILALLLIDNNTRISIEEDYQIHNGLKVNSCKLLSMFDLMNYYCNISQARSVFKIRLIKAGKRKISKIVCFFLKPSKSIYFNVKKSMGSGIVIIHNYGAYNIESIGDNCKMHQGVTIGNCGTGRPTIGNNVFIGANAVILGNCNIGSNVKIGASTLIINQDIPDNCTVVGNPCRIINN